MGENHLHLLSLLLHLATDFLHGGNNGKNATPVWHVREPHMKGRSAGGGRNVGVREPWSPPATDPMYKNGGIDISGRMITRLMTSDSSLTEAGHKMPLSAQLSFGLFFAFPGDQNSNVFRGVKLNRSSLNG